MKQKGNRKEIEKNQKENRKETERKQKGNRKETEKDNEKAQLTFPLQSLFKELSRIMAKGTRRTLSIIETQ